VPEGDNIKAHAGELAALVGVPLAAVFARGVEMRGLRGRAVTRVEARGKHLVIAFDEGSAVRVHLGIAGSWRHRARAATATMAQATLALATAHDVWLCSARTIEWSRARFVDGARALTRLGPDLLGDAPDLDAVVARARDARHAARPIGELLLDQTIAAGLGNVYKCELLFLHGVNPWTRVDAVDDATLRALFADGIKWLRANVGRARTTTADVARGELPARGRGRLWVYGRWRRPCHRCGAAIELRRQRPSLRPTFWCPRCQPERTSGASAS
jgi:endonuclease-8